MASCSREEPAVPIGHKGIKKRNFFSSYRSKSCSPVRGGKKQGKSDQFGPPVLPAVGRNWSQWVCPVLVVRFGGELGADTRDPWTWGWPDLLWMPLGRGSGCWHPKRVAVCLCEHRREVASLAV